MIRMALEQFGLRFKIGHHHAQLVAYFLDRATNPTFDKLAAHYPDHPRAGAPILHPKADFGICVANALNVKRGYWRVTKHFGQASTQAQVFSAGPSPFGSTPDSAGQMHHAGQGARIESDSPQTQVNAQSRSASLSGPTSTDTTLVDAAVSGSKQKTWNSSTGTAGMTDVAEANISFLLPNVATGPTPGPYTKNATTGWINFDAWVSSTSTSGTGVQGDTKATSANADSNSDSAGQVSNPSARAQAPGAKWGIHDPYKVQPDGTRHIFGHMPQDPSLGVGPTLALPSDCPAAPAASRTGSISGSSNAGGAFQSENHDLEEVGSGFGPKGVALGRESELLAETAAWFMGPEKGWAKGDPVPVLGATFAGFRGPRG